MKPSDKEQSKVLLVAQEISLVKVLVSNEKRLRQKGMKRLKKWLKIKSSNLTRDDLLRLWKGLYCCMWMTDKPLIQEEVANAMGNLIQSLDSVNLAVHFVGSFFQTMAREWYGIDQLRLDKFMMLVRRVLRHAFVYCHKRGWSQDVVQNMCQEFSDSVLTTGMPLGLVMHFTDIYLEELAKVSKGQISSDIVMLLVEPFVNFLSKEKDGRLTSHVSKHIFDYLLIQSEEGQEYKAKFDAWIKAGCPGDSWKDMERVDDKSGSDEDDDDEMDIELGNTDPRAGQVDVILRPLQFDSKSLASLFKSYRDKTFDVKNRRILLKHLDRFRKMAEGEYPLAENLQEAAQIRKHLKRRHHKSKALKGLLKYDFQLQNENERKRKKRKHKRLRNGKTSSQESICSNGDEVMSGQ